VLHEDGVGECCVPDSDGLGVVGGVEGRVDGVLCTGAAVGEACGGGG
jgi:hypothetical protein